MHIHYSDKFIINEYCGRDGLDAKFVSKVDEIAPSIFMAGPTPHEPYHGLSWRNLAIDLLYDLQFNGSVFVPEPFKEWPSFENQVEWEELHLKTADCILFWIPRDMTGDTYGCPMPGLTTNVEFGMWMNSGKVVIGCPGYAQHVRYILYYANKLNIATATSLYSTLQLAVDMCTKKEK